VKEGALAAAGLFGAVAAALVAGACSGSPAADADAAAPPTCSPGNGGVTDVTAFPQTIDAFCQVDIQNATVTPKSTAVVPYDLNTPLFSDYADKFRTVWIPPGASARYTSDGVLDFPVGTVITKSFGWPKDFTKASDPVHWLETRVLVHTAGHGWTGAAYEWNEAQTRATLVAGGDVKAFTFVGQGGKIESPTYLIPSEAQCRQCHATDGTFTPIGPTAAQLNRVYGGAATGDTEVVALSKLGMLSGAPAQTDLPKLPIWDDPTTGSTEQRARAYLQANCAFCHDGKGEARTTGLVLTYAETQDIKFGVCKPPVAAGKASGNDQYDVVPGQPQSSILIRRVSSTEPVIAMPELERSLEHTEGVALLTAWVTGLHGRCK
jgi:uncharacterized repeat protein (TIGR03806 family)